MNRKILVLLATIMFVPTIGMAYDQGTPASYAVNYQSVSDTTFSVTVVGTETAMNFSGNRDSKWVAPNGTSDGTNPWAAIINQGNVNQNFRVNLGSNNPASIQLYASNFSDMSGKITLSTVYQSPTGWTGVAPSAGVSLYTRANFTLAPASVNTITISTQ